MTALGDTSTLDLPVAAWEQVIERMAAGVALIRTDNLTLAYVNRAFAAMLGYEPRELEGRHVDILMPEGDSQELFDRTHGLTPRLAETGVATFEARNRRKDGSTIWVRVTIRGLELDGEAPLGIVVQEDITEAKRANEALRFQAEHDPLTGVFNRRRFQAELERELARAERSSSHGAVLVIDLDGFKRVNDRLGHARGDEVLVTVAGALGSRLRSTDVLARLGGDEFGIILPDTDERGAKLVARHLSDAVRQAARLDHRREIPPVEASVGISLFGDPRTPVGDGELVVEADVALYRAKRAGRARIAVFDPE